MAKSAVLRTTIWGEAANGSGLGFPMEASNSSDTALTFLNAARKKKKSPEVSFYLGAMLQSQGRHKEAIVQYQKAVDLGLRDAALYSNLGLAWSDTKQYPKAVETLNLALRLDPGFISARHNLGVVLQAMGRLDEAKANYMQVLSAQPDHMEALSNLCEVLRLQGALNEAEECIKNALAVYPDHVGLLLNLGATMHALGRFEEAEACYKQVLSIDPKHAMTHNNLGVTMYAKGQLDEAKTHYEQALSIDPENSDAHNNIGVVMLDQGHLAMAEESYWRAIALKPDFTKAHLHYVHAKKITYGDQELLAHLEELAGRPELAAEERSDVHFALGKCYDDLGAYKQAFLHFENGHRLERQNNSFDSAQHANNISDLIATFSKEFFLKKQAVGRFSETPIFIVGMPRSGTTLVEQIISSHTSVFGAGELYFLDDRLKKIPLSSVDQLDCQEVLSLADEYEAYLRSFSSSASHITDKMPQNFFHLGFIRLLFPQACIIHCKRNPLDTCLSIYTQKFVASHPYAHEIESMAQYYEQYERLMRHWEEVLPGKKLFEVQYEELISNQSTVSRHILEYCDIEWDDRCLAFEQNKRVVHTASSWQVRQPIYSSSIGRWRNYQSFLEPLRRLESSVVS